MSVCRIAWPWRRSLRYIDNATQLPVDTTAWTFSAVVVEQVNDALTGTILKTFTSAQGYLYAQAGGHIVIDIPAAQMAMPLYAGRFGFELRRTDGGRSEVIGTFSLNILGTNEVLDISDTTTDLTVVSGNADLVVSVSSGIPGRDGLTLNEAARFGFLLGEVSDQTNLFNLIESKAALVHTHPQTQITQGTDLVLLFENQLV